MVDLTKKNADVSILAACAVRYGLGRKTYITSMISESIIALKDAILERDAWNMIKDIDTALDGGRYGHECDKENWLRLRDVLGEVLVKGGG